MRIEEVLARLDNLTLEDFNNETLEVEDLVNISPCLHTDNYLTYIIFLGIRKDLPEDMVEAYKALINALKKREHHNIKKQYAHFEERK